ncbi:MAG: hypothetical protein L0H70_02175, partial [Xanthomonadales bacterium]|nr:hypothetical protein [Xanthomonadales bacterium]
DGIDSLIDDKTWMDLEFPRIFIDANCTVTSVGAQILYCQMRIRPLHSADLAARHGQHLELQSNRVLREAIQQRLLLLRGDESAWISEFLFAELPPPAASRWKIACWGVVSLVTPIALLVLAWPMWLWLVVLLVNVVIIMRLSMTGHIMRDINTLRSCLRLARVADSLAAMDHSLATDAVSYVMPLITKLRNQRTNRTEVRRSLRWLSFLKLPCVNTVARILNVAVLLELYSHLGAMRKFSRLRPKLRESFRLVGEIDAAMAVASWLVFRPNHCFPTLTNERGFQIENGQHPLLDAPVTNSIALSGRSVLVTGSNMAGKTTFIKMLGVNVILAQTLGFCFATSASVPFSNVMACIHSEHSVETGLSHYMAETLRIRSFLNQPTLGLWNIFIIDELFSGTNTIERIAIAQAVLRALSRNALVLATTHDVELQSILQDCFSFYHFQEDPDVDGFFDYRLRSGATNAHNAIRLLAELDFPRPVIEDAEGFTSKEYASPVFAARSSLHPHQGMAGAFATTGARDAHALSQDNPV